MKSNTNQKSSTVNKKTIIYPSFKCYNNKCPMTFFNEKGLLCHLDKSMKCKQVLKQIKLCQKKINISLSIKKTLNKSNNHNTTDAVNTNEMNESIHLQNGFSKICFSNTLFHQTKRAKFWRMQIWQIMFIKTS